MSTKGYFSKQPGIRRTSTEPVPKTKRRISVAVEEPSPRQSKDENPDLRGKDQSQQEDTVVIAVMGVTGSGKSSLISLLADQPVGIGHNLQSHTTHIDMFSFTHPEKKNTVILLDTPGFDDTDRSDTEILKEISCFLAMIHEKRWRLVGVVYLHRITDPRLGGSAMKNLHMFEKLCGTRSFAGVVLVTTMWEDLGPTEADQAIGHRRQTELENEFWKTIIAEGGNVMEHDGSAESASTIVSSLVKRNEEVVLHIVHELVDERKTLDETDAGQYVQAELLKIKKKYDREIADLQESMEEAMEARDEATARAIKREKEAAKAKVAQKARESKGLKVSMSQLVQEKMAEYHARATEPDHHDAFSGRIADLFEELKSEVQEMKHQQQLQQQMLTQLSQTQTKEQRVIETVEQPEGGQEKEENKSGGLMGWFSRPLSGFSRFS
ncbi:P-loop containing nucleoside triphosphate hydrolase protein [Aspergillus alliaceus]|uniref:P-loop containing nucleoside triphosphate hydrolase protein n=1 Tax=Petromyces alliaceus TaxID=209559 RepID=A0A5N7C491_PETAA|nr:P-loop containing nucleoside triphosphate hydrolase protein [Aspergillus alliaceus]KAB8234978.1 P-loop containing nucleoside triphosphate hydrolase protein [Aspergillus alliaceus]KAE8388910.1 P-loop containing nucleoside triphosphate hydrolase protein [Aspergillus alliaceus]